MRKVRHAGLMARWQRASVLPRQHCALRGALVPHRRRFFSVVPAQDPAFPAVAAVTASPVSDAPTVTVSYSRLKEFLLAEMVHLASTNTITVDQILEHATAQDVAALIDRELPSRFASRIQQIEQTCPQWRDVPGMVELHTLVSESFCMLRLADHHAKEGGNFPSTVFEIGRRHGSITPMLLTVASGLKEHGVMSEDCISEWIDTWMRSRIGTEMLISQYQQLLSNPDGSGIVEAHCEPGQICQNAVKHVQDTFDMGGLTIELHQEQQDISLSFVPRYLFLIVQELLKNSIAATLLRLRQVESVHGVVSEKMLKECKVRVAVCADAHRILIRIRDRAGGISDENSDRIWRYTFSDTPEDLQSRFQEQCLIDGPGVGLPMAKLYTTYLGGSLDLLTMPSWGTDVYLSFDRIVAPGDPGRKLQFL
eukprot:TRINITY_DN112606_c0_g1_i1.p1 TRINITY_DN112606_c0_g1~~TRINITY_DN112606_c0_g1_i1.p1  ORF type:complete len:423 (-),score=31.83 TRINITY_DN112606_c0_g1_i1:156-1424(-)